ncbi:UDP-N-acetylglucosamine 2-epimerase, partial [Stenotrophomonas maltophilia]|uniref:UDP-N-acetylglucosamine 2-epimerase n=1 Tax=Stenotrophomonas maltophilia TaxID=40324 RepID=UPI0013D9BEAC
HRPDIEASQILSEQGLEAGRYFVASAHREENVDNEDNLRELMTALDQLIRKHSWPVLFSTHPRTRQRLAAARIDNINPLI